MWHGDTLFLLWNLVQKDFKIRYRNMSLGMFWSLLNPLVMMTVLTFVFTKLLGAGNPVEYALSVLCGLVPFNFFALSVATATGSLNENSQLIKRVPVPREIVPVATVLSNGLHVIIQFGLVFAAVIVFGRGITIHWLWLPVLMFLELVFICGVSLATSALNVFVRDMRYVVESANTVLFYLVPIFYSWTIIPQKYVAIYQANPLAALILSVRKILIDGQAPLGSTMINLTIAAFGTLGLGWLLFQSVKKRFYEYL